MLALSASDRFLRGPHGLALSLWQSLSGAANSRCGSCRPCWPIPHDRCRPSPLQTANHAGAAQQAAGASSSSAAARRLAA